MKQFSSAQKYLQPNAVNKNILNSDQVANTASL